MLPEMECNASVSSSAILGLHVRVGKHQHLLRKVNSLKSQVSIYEE